MFAKLIDAITPGYVILFDKGDGMPLPHHIIRQGILFKQSKVNNFCWLETNRSNKEAHIARYSEWLLRSESGLQAMSSKNQNFQPISRDRIINSASTLLDYGSPHFVLKFPIMKPALIVAWKPRTGASSNKMPIFLNYKTVAK